jgi:hypothetical protein
VLHGLNVTSDSGFNYFAVDTGAVPERAAWALLIAGFGLSGLMLRRRRTSAYP